VRGAVEERKGEEREESRPRKENPPLITRGEDKGSK
jgi:hypothetical protein